MKVKESRSIYAKTARSGTVGLVPQKLELGTKEGMLAAAHGSMVPRRDCVDWIETAENLAPRAEENSKLTSDEACFVGNPEQRALGKVIVCKKWVISSCEVEASDSAEADKTLEFGLA